MRYTCDMESTCRCGVELGRKRRGAAYCSSACRQAAYRARRPKTPPDRPWRACAACESPIEPSASPRKVYCNDTCRKRYRQMWLDETAERSLARHHEESVTASETLGGGDQ